MLRSTAGAHQRRSRLSDRPIGGFIAGLLTGGDYISGINVTTIVVAVIGAVIAVVAWKAIRGQARTGSGPI